MPKHTCTKRYRDLPAAHRNHLHAGHCQYIHGHNYTVEITFGCDTLDACGFVVDFGNLGPVKEYLKNLLDHTLLLAFDDPLKAVFLNRAENDYSIFQDTVQVRVVPGTSCEDLTRHLFIRTAEITLEITSGRAWVETVTVWEDSKNRATYHK